MVAPEGKILAELVRQRLKKTLMETVAGATQFGFMIGRGTEEAICKALTHVDEARERTLSLNKIGGQGHRGVSQPDMKFDMT